MKNQLPLVIITVLVIALVKSFTVSQRYISPSTGLGMPVRGDEQWNHISYINHVVFACVLSTIHPVSSLASTNIEVYPLDLCLWLNVVQLSIYAFISKERTGLQVYLPLCEKLLIGEFDVAF